jgi:hypothetical protein
LSVRSFIDPALKAKPKDEIKRDMLYHRWTIPFMSWSFFPPTKDYDQYIALEQRASAYRTAIGKAKDQQDVEVALAQWAKDTAVWKLF